MFVRNVDAAAPCAITGPSTAVATATLLSKAGLVLWGRLDPVAGNLVGSATSVATCKTTPFANNVLRWLPAGDEGVTFLDETALTTDDSTLRYSAITNGTLPAQGTALQTHARSNYAPLAPTLPAILYTGATTAAAGLYIYVGPPLPGAAPPGDGGATDGPTDGGADANDATGGDADAASADADAAGVDADAAGGDADAAGAADADHDAG
jgi:hypothetical protein